MRSHIHHDVEETLHGQKETRKKEESKWHFFPLHVDHCSSRTKDIREEEVSCVEKCLNDRFSFDTIVGTVVISILIFTIVISIFLVCWE